MEILTSLGRPLLLIFYLVTEYTFNLLLEPCLAKLLIRRQIPNPEIQKS